MSQMLSASCDWCGEAIQEEEPGDVDRWLRDHDCLLRRLDRELSI